MNRFRGTLVFLMTMAALTLSALAQTFPSPHYIDQLFRPPHGATQVPGAQSIQDYVANGKLAINLEQTIRLMLLNNTELHINQLQYQQSLFAIQKAFGPFDPVFTTSFSPQRSVSPSTS